MENLLVPTHGHGRHLLICMVLICVCAQSEGTGLFVSEGEDYSHKIEDYCS